MGREIEEVKKVRDRYREELKKVTASLTLGADKTLINNMMMNNKEQNEQMKSMIS